MDAKINKPLLSDTVTNYLRKKILLGHYGEGYHLSEVQLSEELQVSRGPVRDAIKRLENESLVKTKRNGRTVVVGFTLKDVMDLFETRKTLELKAIETIIDQNLNTTILPQLKPLIKEMKKQKDLEHLLLLDHSFHYKLMELSENRTLLNLWASISNLIITLTEISNDNFGDLVHINEVHEKLMLAVSDGNKKLAKDLMNRHIDEGAATISDYLKNDKGYD